MAKLSTLPTAKSISRDLQDRADPQYASQSMRYFKTGKGDYAEGDRFVGIRVPVLRSLAAVFGQTPLKELQQLIMSSIHEERMLSLLILVRQFAEISSKRSRDLTQQQQAIFDFYLNNTRYINNWDLVDCSASQIVGAALEHSSRQPLFDLAESDSLWERRIAMIATLWFIRRNQFDDALKIADLLHKDQEDLIQKAVGWMLREVGNRDAEIEKSFLKSRYKGMPRTLLRYAIERFPEKERKAWLRGDISVS